MPTRRYGISGGVINGKFYVVGGYDYNFRTGGSSGRLNNLEIYDPFSDTWTIRKPMPTVRSGTAVGVIDGNLYVAGGFGPVPSLARLDTLEIYDPVTDSWTIKSSMSIERSGAAAGVIDGRFYVVGGYNPDAPDQVSGTLSILEVYDPTSDTWASKAPMPTARTLARCGVIDGKLYVVGGITYLPVESGNNNTLDILEVYDPVSDSWATEVPMPTARYAPVAGVINGKLYVVGGKYIDPEGLLYDDGEYNIIEVYDPIFDSWETVAPMLITRKLMAAGVIDNKLLVVGGFNWEIGGSLDILEIYTP